MSTSYLLMILGQLAVMAAAAAVLFFLGSDSRSQHTAGATRSDTDDAKRISAIFAEIGSVLTFHGRALLGVSRPGDSGDEGEAALQHAANFATLRHCNRETNRSLQNHNAELDRLMTHCGDLYHAERNRLDAYAAKTEQLNRALGASGPRSPEGDPTLLQLVHEMQDENEQLRRKVAECQRQAADLVAHAVRSDRDARVDSLTQLPNRRAWDEHWQTGDSSESSYIALLDLDRFKQINDEYGHPAGDAVLTLLGTLLSELPETSAFRIGGDEFGLLVQEAAPERMHQLIERLRTKIERSTVHHQDQPLRVTVSFGVARIGQGDWRETAVQRADQALYAAKSAGGNRTHFCLEDPACLEDPEAEADAPPVAADDGSVPSSLG